MKKFLNIKKKSQNTPDEIVNYLIYGTSKPTQHQPVKKWDENEEINFDEIPKHDKKNEEKLEGNKKSMNLSKFDTKGRNFKIKNVYDITDINNQTDMEINYHNENENELIFDGSGSFIKEETRDLLKSQTIDKTKSIKPKSVIHPRHIPNQKLDVIYSYDTIQLMESFKLIEFKKNNLNKLIDMLAVIRKKKDLKIYDFPEVTNAIQFIRNNLSSIPTSYVISFVYSLSKLQSLDVDKPSLDNQNLVYESIAEITAKLDRIDLRGMSNFVFALHSFQMKNPLAYNFGEFFTKLEDRIVATIEKQKKNITTQDITNIVIAYCKTQNGSEEFYRIIQEILITMKDLLKTQDVAVIIYSFANNANCNEKILEILEENIKVKINKFLPKELCNILRGYHKRNLLSDSLKQKLIEAFIDKYEFTNATDLAYFYSILADEKEARFIKFARKGILNLTFTFSGLDLAVIFEKADFIQKKDPEMYQALRRRVEKLIKDKSINGHDLKKIYINVKDLAFEGKYNTFVELIEKQLEMQRYF